MMKKGRLSYLILSILFLIILIISLSLYFIKDNLILLITFLTSFPFMYFILFSLSYTYKTLGNSEKKLNLAIINILRFLTLVISLLIPLLCIVLSPLKENSNNYFYLLIVPSEFLVTYIVMLLTKDR